MDSEKIVDDGYLRKRAEDYIRIGQYAAANTILVAIGDLKEFAIGDLKEWGYVCVANDYYESGKHDYALDLYKKAMNADSDDDAHYLWERGQLGQKLGCIDNAIRDFTEAIDVGPEKPEYYCSRGVLLAKQGQHEQAISDFGNAIQLDPENIEAYKNRAMSYRVLGEVSKALEDEQFAQSLEG